MPNLRDTVNRLAAQRKTMVRTAPLPADHGELVPLARFGSNPGNLLAWRFVPDDLAPGAPLVVVLHGCTQNAAVYDRGSGWSELAAEAGFALLFAEQVRGNNPNLCFNWFVPGDVTRGQGEVESIRQMIAAMVAAHRLDAGKVFVTGLSAGGAMTASMLATAPELFAGGAIIAGVAHGTAGTVNDAFDRMRGNGLPNAAATAAIIRAASAHHGPWPRLSVWHGSADTTVDAANAEAIADGWARLTGVGAPSTETINGHRRRVWRDTAGRETIESFTVNGMGHGTPVTTKGAEACGSAAPHMLEAGISSTRRIAAFWGIAPAVAAVRTSAPGTRTAAPPAHETSVSRVIDTALRQAGLLR